MTNMNKKASSIAKLVAASNSKNSAVENNSSAREGVKTIKVSKSQNSLHKIRIIKVIYSQEGIKATVFDGNSVKILSFEDIATARQQLSSPKYKMDETIRAELFNDNLKSKKINKTENLKAVDLQSSAQVVLKPETENISSEQNKIKENDLNSDASQRNFNCSSESQDDIPLERPMTQMDDPINSNLPETCTFDKFFEDKKYEPLYKELKRHGIVSFPDLKKINLWFFMNGLQLYSIQQRLEISSELNTRLKSIDKVDDYQDFSYEIYHNDVIYKGTSPSKVFVEFLTGIAVKYPLKFRTLLGAYNQDTKKIVVSRYNDLDQSKLKLLNPEAYVESNLSLMQVRQYIDWVIRYCNVSPKAYTLQEKKKGIETSLENDTDCQEIKSGKEDSNYSSKDVEQSDKHLAVASNLCFVRNAEEYLLKCDSEGSTYEALQHELRYTRLGTKEVVLQSPHIIEMNNRLYHEDALVDFEEGATNIENILNKLLKKNNGITTAKLLYEYASSEMTMFLNDNGIKEQQSVYDFARYLFEKLKYHGKQYFFRSNMYISLPAVSAVSNVDIMKRFAREKGSTVTLKELEDYLTGLGLSTGNLRGVMRVNKEAVFLVYGENEYLLAELMRIDEAFLDKIRNALHCLFADADGYIIPRSISDSWYSLLPHLPASLPWTPLLLQQMILFYSEELRTRTIVAMESQSSNTLNAMFVEKDSWIQDFRDAVAFYIHEEIPNRNEFEAEELRKLLVKSGMINGNELISNMHNALSCDSRFLWNSDGNYVKVRM